MDVPDLREIVDIAAPVAAALAAGLSAFTARQSWNLARSANLPDLSVELTIDADHLHLGCTIHNAGTGVARNVYVIQVHGGQQATAYVPTGVIRANERFSMTTPMQGARRDIGQLAGADTAAAVFCRDRQRAFHAWTHDGRHKQWSARKVDSGTLADRFHELFPEIRLDGLQSVAPALSDPK